MNVGPVPHGVTDRPRLTDCPINGAPARKRTNRGMGVVRDTQHSEILVAEDRLETPDR